MHKDIQTAIDQFKANTDSSSDYEHIVIEAPKWLEMDAESQRGLNLLETVNLITARCRKLL